MWKSIFFAYFPRNLFVDKFVDNSKSYLQFPFGFVENDLFTDYSQLIHRELWIGVRALP